MKPTHYHIFRNGQQRIVLGALGLGLIAASANAQTTIYDTTGGNTTFQYPAYQVGPDSDYIISVSFDVSTPADLSSIGLFLAPTWSSAGGVIPADYNVELTNAGYGQPGSVLDSWTTAGQGALVTLNANGTDFLGAGTYDVVVGAVTGGAWSINSADDGTFDAYLGFGGYGWVPQIGVALPEMKIQVTPLATPEPASMVAMGAGLFGLLLRKRSRRRTA